jgi:hypothetical protein
MPFTFRNIIIFVGVGAVAALATATLRMAAGVVSATVNP